MNAKEAALANIEMQKLYQEAFKRYEMGREHYGVFNPRTDTRDLHKEFEDEILDSINYLCMILIKHRACVK